MRGCDGSATDTTAAELAERWRAASVLVSIGSACVVAGGLVAAVTGPTDFDHRSWLSVYLVLVGGVAQIALGILQYVLRQFAGH